LDTFHPDILYLREQRCEDLWLLFKDHRVPPTKKFGKHFINVFIIANMKYLRVKGLNRRTLWAPVLWLNVICYVLSKLSILKQILHAFAHLVLSCQTAQYPNPKDKSQWNHNLWFHKFAYTMMFWLSLINLLTNKSVDKKLTYSLYKCSFILKIKPVTYFG
jgi:hypothetical protein